MKTLTFVIVLVSTVILVLNAVHIALDSPSWHHALLSFQYRALIGYQQLHAWVYVFAFAFGAGLIEGYLWRRKQVFAGFHQSLFRSSILTAFLIILVGLGHLTSRAHSVIALWILVGLSYYLGLALLAGRPLVR